MDNEIVATRAGPADRLPGLDFLRAIAIVWVLLFHASLFELVSQDSWIVRFGWMGVDLFFVLSGFLIAGQLFRPWARGDAPDYRRFFARRLLRTLPAYLAVVALYFAFPSARDRPNIQPLWQFLTFTQNFALNFPLPKAFSHAWSLCVEEQFYLAFPLVAALIAIRPSAGKVIGAVVVVLLAGMMLRGYCWLNDVARESFNPAARPDAFAYMTLIYYPTWTRLDGLLAGIAVAAIQTFRPHWWRRLTARPNVLLGAGAAGVGVAIVFFRDMVAGFLPTIFGFPLLACAMALLVIAGADKRSLISRYTIPGAGALAAVAYSLYLSNKIVFHAVQGMMRDAPAQIQSATLCAGLLAALAAGAVLYWLVERPFLRLRDRLRSPSRSGGRSQPPAPTPAPERLLAN
jgi:peptidoglycan/LPS O-acetylase OafA/YrhL